MKSYIYSFYLHKTVFRKKSKKKNAESNHINNVGIIFPNISVHTYNLKKMHMVSFSKFTLQRFFQNLIMFNEKFSKWLLNDSST